MSYNSVFVGNATTGFTYSEPKPSITGVRVYISEDECVLVGTEENAIDVDVLIATSTQQAQIYGQSILSTLQNWHYQPFTANNALVDPASSLGDGITVRGVYSTIFKRSTQFNALAVQTVTAPAEEETDHEFKFVSSEKRKQDRKYKQIEDTFEAALTVQATEIRAEVSQVQTNLDGVQASLESQLSVQAGEISAKVSKNSPSGQTSFSWAMDDTSHTWYANNVQVMKVSSSGL